MSVSYSRLGPEQVSKKYFIGRVRGAAKQQIMASSKFLLLKKVTLLVVLIFQTSAYSFLKVCRLLTCHSFVMNKSLLFFSRLVSVIYVLLRSYFALSSNLLSWNSVSTVLSAAGFVRWLFENASLVILCVLCLKTFTIINNWSDELRISLYYLVTIFITFNMCLISNFTIFLVEKSKLLFVSFIYGSPITFFCYWRLFICALVPFHSKFNLIIINMGLWESFLSIIVICGFTYFAWEEFRKFSHCVLSETVRHYSWILTKSRNAFLSPHKNQAFT